MIPTPLKYAGNKRKIMRSIAKHFDWEGITRYVEPFVGALGSAVNAEVPDGVQVCLSDVNSELVRFYDQWLLQAQAVQDLANSWSTTESTYYQIRSWDRDDEARTTLQWAARTLYLNKRGFNGLYRLNSKGQCNVPWNRNVNAKRIDVIDCRFTNFLKRADGVTCADAFEVINGCGAGDLVYCDPPYVDVTDPLKRFGGYVGAFGPDQQGQLRDAVQSAAARGAQVLVSNSWCSATLDLYANFEQHEITAPRSISCKANGRGAVTELLAVLNGHQTTSETSVVQTCSSEQ